MFNTDISRVGVSRAIDDFVRALGGDAHSVSGIKVDARNHVVKIDVPRRYTNGPSRFEFFFTSDYWNDEEGE